MLRSPELSMDLEISKVAGAGLSEDGRTATIEFVTRGGEALRLTLDPQDQEELQKLIEALRARSEESAAAPTPTGAWSAAYQNVQSVEIGVDASLTTLLLDFDRTRRQRVGVAIPVELARKVGLEIRQAAGRALSEASRQKAS
jgi:hypothetical protein